MILRISKNDIKIILMSSTIFVGAFLALYFDLFANLNEKSDRPIFAKTVEVDNDVRMKSDQQLAWAKSSTKDYVRFGDQIFTGEKSNVVLQLEDNQKIRIQENSLVKFEQKKNVKNFKIVFGSMTTQVKKGELIEVIVCGEKIKIAAQSDDEVKISNNDNCAKPEVKLKLNSQKQKIVLKPKKRQIATVTKAIIEKVSNPPVEALKPVELPIQIPTPQEPVALAIPAPQEPVALAIPAPQEPVALAIPAPQKPVALAIPVLKKQNYKFMATEKQKKVEWSSVENAKSYLVKIFDSENANNLINKFESKTSTYDFKPTDSLRYSFSVQALSQNKLFLNSNDVKGDIEIVYPLIKIENPEKSYTFEARTSDQKLPQLDHKIAWTQVPTASYYQLEVASDSEFSKVLMSEKVKENSFDYLLKDAGKYFYRIKAYSNNQKELTRSSSSGQVEYIKKFDLRAPVLTDQMKNQVFVFQSTQGQFIRLSWQNKQSDKAPNYYVELSTTKDFKSIYRKYNSDRSYIMLSSFIPQGFYYWKVRSYGQSIVSDWSEIGTLKIQTKRAIAEDKKN